ncbi:tetratricopeptide repeat protein [Paenibacillus humicus]|uniref:tetratricopeptide repeat protein n=1 Tax=Paenibacillus humicus TaxID=412861 RepID=UPI003F159FDF
MPHDWDKRVALLWGSADALSREEFVARMERLASELPEDSPEAAFERAASLEHAGQSDLAVPLYRRALSGGLKGERRRLAVIQLASLLRGIGALPEAIALLSTEQRRGSDHLDDAVQAFLALCLADAGEERQAASIALAALAGHLPRYRHKIESSAKDLLKG